LEIRKVGRYYLSVVAAITACVLLLREPLGKADIALGVLAAVQGWILAHFIFSDRGQTQSFVFSRPFSRNRLFLMRWGLGLVLQALTVTAVLALIALGGREYVQVESWRSPWYPMVKWYELRCLWTIWLVSLFVYQVSMCFMLRGQARDHNTPAWCTAAAAFPSLVLAIFAVCVMRTPTGYGVTGVLPSVLWTLVWAYFAGVIVLTTWASVHSYRIMEIEA